MIHVIRARHPTGEFPISLLYAGPYREGGRGAPEADRHVSHTLPLPIDLAERVP